MSNEKALMERFRKEKIAVRTGTVENLDRFLEMCARQGMKWRTGSNANEWKPNENGGNVIVCYGYDDKNCITYSAYDDGLKEGWSVIDFDSFIKSAENDYQQIVITSDGKTTTARLVDGKKTVKTATAVCSPDDTFDFQTGAKIAFERLTAEEKKPEPEKPALEIKVGDKVKIRSWESMEKEFGLDEDGDINMHPCCFLEGMREYCGGTYIVYGVATFKSDERFFLKEIKDWVFTKDMFERIVTDEPSEPADTSVKEVHREAKVGEYVKLLTDGEYGYVYTVGKVYKVEMVNILPHLRSDNGRELLSFTQREYVVLEGYKPENAADDEKKDEKPETFRDRLKREHPKCVNDAYSGGCEGCPEDYGYENVGFDCSGISCKECWDRPIPTDESKKPEKPKYLNGKVVCVKAGYPWWTVGKVYDVVDGIITANGGCTYPKRGREPYKDYEDVRHAGCLNDEDPRHNITNEFIEFKG